MINPERIPLVGAMTPLVRLDRLSHALGGAQIWMKRDDLTGLETSGNKVRKLEYVAAATLRANCDTLVTEGTPQSNHCRATAAVCARIGLRAVLLLRPEPPAGPPQGNYLLDHLFGAECRTYERAHYDAERDAIAHGVLEELRAAGRQPRWTPAGASEPVGCWGYIRAAAELATQLADARIDSCDIVVAISSGGTYTGLLLGRQTHRLRHVDIHAVPVSDNVDFHRRNVEKLFEQAVAEFELPTTFEPQAVHFMDGFVGEGYAIPYPDELAAIRQLAQLEGIVLDPVYTGKAFCALLAAVRERRLGFERPVIFLHTGGIFSDFAWPQALFNH